MADELQGPRGQAMSAERADLSAPPRTRYLVIALVAMIHVSVILGLIRAFAPDFTSRVAGQVLAAFTVTVTTTPPKPPPPRQPEKSGAAAETGKQAVPREAAAPRPQIAIARLHAPPVAGTGRANNDDRPD